MSDLFLIAHLAGRAVAIASEQVGSVVDLSAIVPAPGADRLVRGLAALRSRVVTVIDTRDALGLPGHETAAGYRAIVSRIDGHDYAFLVDALDDVASFARLPLTNGVVPGERWREAAVGVIERDGEPIVVLDLRALVPGLQAAA